MRDKLLCNMEQPKWAAGKQILCYYDKSVSINLPSTRCSNTRGIVWAEELISSETQHHNTWAHTLSLHINSSAFLVLASPITAHVDTGLHTAIVYVVINHCFIHLAIYLSAVSYKL